MIDALYDRLATELGIDPDRYGGERLLREQIAAFLSSGSDDPLASGTAWRELIAKVVIPETRFFRYPESFAELQLLAAAQAGRHLEILCAACSTGEEAWSIAMALRAAGHQKFHVDALDISEASVLHARRGDYTLRDQAGLPGEIKSRWFESETGICAELRGHVSFRVANLIEDASVGGIYDVIFCRNFLIYCTVESQHRIFALLDAHLATDGVLFLGPGEATCAAGHGWIATPHPMSFAFVRSKTKTASLQRIRHVPQSPPPAATAPAERRLPAPPLQKPAADMNTARFLADSGRIEEASEELEAFHAGNEPTADSLLLKGILAEAHGDVPAAETAYRKSVYLDPQHLDTLWHLSLLLESDGRTELARPFRRRAERLAGK